MLKKNTEGTHSVLLPFLKGDKIFDMGGTNLSNFLMGGGGEKKFQNFGGGLK